MKHRHQGHCGLKKRLNFDGRLLISTWETIARGKKGRSLISSGPQRIHIRFSARPKMEVEIQFQTLVMMLEI